MSLRVISIGLLALLLQGGHALAGDAAVTGSDLVKDPNTIQGKVEAKVESSLSNDGPWLLFGVIMLAGVGIPISEEILIVPAGFLIERGVLPFWWTVAAAWTGVVLADLLWMLLVRRCAHRLLAIRFFRRMFHPRRILEIKYMLDRWGAWVVVMGRILPAARTPVITAAGLAHMPIGKFMLGECVGAAKSVAWQLFVGWLIAKGLGESVHDRHVRDAVLIGVGVLAVVVVAWWWRRRHQSRCHRPRAPMRWLRSACLPPEERRRAQA
ncbi:MAG: DedA family protein [Phycisphaerales bacterium]|jgi:membrane protein DedA with SNARE-associated domain|nr:DedA family protein [Phycisphaerales bacterium]